jgi:hypothetical protein
MRQMNALRTKGIVTSQTQLGTLGDGFEAFLNIRLRFNTYLSSTPSHIKVAPSSPLHIFLGSLKPRLPLDPQTFKYTFQTQLGIQYHNTMSQYHSTCTGCSNYHPHTICRTQNHKRLPVPTSLESSKKTSG